MNVFNKGLTSCGKTPIANNFCCIGIGRGSGPSFVSVIFLGDCPKSEHKTMCFVCYVWKGLHFFEFLDEL